MTQDGLVADRTEVGQAVAAVGEHDRQIADHAAVVAAGALLQRGELAGERVTFKVNPPESILRARS
jgi:hypothetical protein